MGLKRNAFVFVCAGDKIVALDADSGESVPVIVDQNITWGGSSGVGFAEVTLRLAFHGPIVGMGAVKE